MNECKNCNMPVGISCCFNCGRDSSKCGVWHDCGKNCPGWEKRIKGDLISRKALLKEYEWLMTQTSDCNKPVLQEHIDRINRQPTVDAVEVVRCKDCIACDRPPFPPTIKLEHGYWCVINDHIVSLDDFCSYGETVDGKCLRETADNKDRREAAEQDAYEQLCNLGNPEDGSL